MCSTLWGQNRNRSWYSTVIHTCLFVSCQEGPQSSQFKEPLAWIFFPKSSNLHLSQHTHFSIEQYCCFKTQQKKAAHVSFRLLDLTLSNLQLFTLSGLEHVGDVCHPPQILRSEGVLFHKTSPFFFFPFPLFQSTRVLPPHTETGPAEARQKNEGGGMIGKPQSENETKCSKLQAEAISRKWA